MYTRAFSNDDFIETFYIKSSVTSVSKPTFFQCVFVMFGMREKQNNHFHKTTSIVSM